MKNIIRILKNILKVLWNAQLYYKRDYLKLDKSKVKYVPFYYTKKEFDAEQERKEKK